MNQEDISHLYRIRTSNDIEIIIKTLPTKKNSGPAGSTDEFIRTLKNS
jgi:hypothetical protein